MVLLSALPVHAQSYAEFTFDHEKDILGQFMVMEGAPVPGVSATFYPTWYYTTFHKGYMYYALPNNKQAFRLVATTNMEKEVAISDSLRHHLQRRATKETLSMVERKMDASLGMEEGRIQGKLDLFNRNISHIVAYGGTDEDYKYWKTLYSCFVKAVDCIHKAYLGNGQRLEEYKAIYTDIIKRNNNLVSLMMQWNRAKNNKDLLNAVDNAKSLRVVSRRAAIAQDSKSRWDTFWGVSGFHNNNDK